MPDTPFEPRVMEDPLPQEETSPKAEETPKEKPRRVPPQDRKLKEAISGMYGTLGLVVIGTAGADDNTRAAGIHIANTADVAADAWMELADTNPKVKAALRRFTEGASFAGLIGVHVAMFAPLAAAKGLIPEQYHPVVQFMASGPGMNGA